MIHDCIYQFLRLFYHSRFKPQQLEMTLSQLSAPVLDLVLVLPLILRLYKDLSRFSNETKLRVQSKPEITEPSPNRRLRSDRIRSIQSENLWSKFLLFSPFYLSSIACLTSGRIRLSILYQAKTYRQTVVAEIRARDQWTPY